MNGINYTTALNNTMQLSQTGVMSRLTPLLKAIAVITVAFIAIGAVYLAITQGCYKRQTREHEDHSSARVPPQTDVVTPQTDAVTPQHDTGTLQPDAVTPQHDTGTLQPDAVIPQHDTGTLQPDAGTLQPDAGTLQPDAGTLQPDAGTLQPDAGTLQPDTVIPQPEIDKTIPPISRSATDNKIQITIKTLQAKTFNMDVYPSDTIHHLQNQICEYYKNLNELPNDIRSTNRDYHRLLYQGKPLEPGRTLSDYEINHDKCMLFVIHRVCR